ncbi:MAG: CRISPR-associated helicase Cas3' [Thermoplasmata archaeon]|nr:CRISPR-associated helicase Cas3' [Thermoplasmata archaeon]
MGAQYTNYLRAKDWRSDRPLLREHLIDTLEQVKNLYEFLQKNPNLKNVMTEEDFKRLAKAAFLHDLGKINYNFQKKVFNKEEREHWSKLADLLDESQMKNEIRHEILSVVWSLFLISPEEDTIRTAILLHHYNPHYLEKKDLMELIYHYGEELKTYTDFLWSHKDEIKSILTSLIQEVKKHFANCMPITSAIAEIENIDWDFKNLKELKEGIEKHADDLSNLGEFYEISNDAPDYNFFLFLGCLRRCDYAASGNVNVEELVNLGQQIYFQLDQRIKKKLGFEESKITWQEEVLKKEDGDNLVLIAPTGSGKTEFALLWAKNRRKKLVYTLPLRVALNDIYSRFTESYALKDYTRILHSTSFIEYLKEEKDARGLNIDTKQTTAKLFSSPLILTTPDQVFLTSLKYYGFDKLISIYPLSAIVLDEIQAYDPEMAAIIIQTLDTVRQLRGNVLVITATFPPYFEKYLNKFKIIDLSLIRITNSIKNYATKRHRIELIDKMLFEDHTENDEGTSSKRSEWNIDKDSLEEIRKIIEKNQNKNILIVVNNVKKAIELYKKIDEEKFGETYLLHSRILEKEKRERIKKVKDCLENKKKVILVATQIVEASVDVDFDILITEISPIDSQIQRWGRVYRNRPSDYPENTPNIYIFTVQDRGTNAIYDTRVIEKTKEVLKDYCDRSLAYTDERKILSSVFQEKSEESKTLKDIYEEEIDKNLEWLKYYSAEKRSEAQRIFRRIAGLQVVVPQIMLRADNDVVRALGKIILDRGVNEKWKDRRWEDICEKIKEDTGKIVGEWELKSFLYEYSTNLPVYYIEKNRFKLTVGEFKGFHVLYISEALVDDCIKFGIDTALKEIESMELNETLIT